MATGDYSYPSDGQPTFVSRDGLPSGDAEKIVKGLHFEREYTAIESAIDLQVNANNPVFFGTMIQGTIDGGTF